MSGFVAFPCDGGDASEFAPSDVLISSLMNNDSDENAPLSLNISRNDTPGDSSTSSTVSPTTPSISSALNGPEIYSPPEPLVWEGVDPMLRFHGTGAWEHSNEVGAQRSFEDDVVSTLNGFITELFTSDPVQQPASQFGPIRSKIPHRHSDRFTPYDDSDSRYANIREVQDFIDPVLFDEQYELEEDIRQYAVSPITDSHQLQNCGDDIAPHVDGSATPPDAITPSVVASNHQDLLQYHDAWFPHQIQVSPSSTALEVQTIATPQYTINTQLQNQPHGIHTNTICTDDAFLRSAYLWNLHALVVQSVQNVYNPSLHTPHPILNDIQFISSVPPALPPLPDLLPINTPSTSSQPNYGKPRNISDSFCRINNCRKHFPKERDLVRHRWTHFPGAREWKCPNPECKKKFSRQDVLQRHLQRPCGDFDRKTFSDWDACFVGDNGIPWIGLLDPYDPSIHVLRV